MRITGVVGGQDGKTAYHKIRSTEHSLRLPFFGVEFGTKGDHRKEVSQAKAPDGAREYMSAFIVAPIST